MCHVEMWCKKKSRGVRFLRDRNGQRGQEEDRQVKEDEGEKTWAHL
jgi:hypothetical protein